MNEIAQPLARFVTESSKITGSSVNSDLFKPNRDLVLSFSRIDDLKHSEIRNIGIDVVKRHGTARRLHGWGGGDSLPPRLMTTTLPDTHT